MAKEIVSIHDMSKTHTVLMMVALILSSMCTMGDFVITPVAANLYEAFSDAPEALVSFAITGPALVAIPAGLIAGWLADRVDKRSFMILGFAIFTVSAVCSGLIDNIYYFVLMRVLATGIGYGITNVCAFAIIAEVFTDNDEHGKMVGYYTVGVNFIGTPLSICAGLAAVAVGVWTGVLFVYLAAIPVLIMLIAFLPKCLPQNKLGATAQEDPEDSVSQGWWKNLLVFAIQVAIIATCYYVTWYMISLYVVDAGIGDETFSGLLTSLITIGGIISAAVYGFFYKRLGNAVYFPFIVVIVVGIFVMAFAPSPLVALITIPILGFSWTQYYCFVYTHCTEIVPKSKIGVSTGVMGACISIGTFLCSYLIMGLADSFGSGSVMAVWWIPGVIILVVAIISFVVFLARNKRKGALSSSGNHENAA